MRWRASAPRDRFPWITASRVAWAIGCAWLLITAVAVWTGTKGYRELIDFQKRAVQIDIVKVSEFRYQEPFVGRTRIGEWRTKSVYDIDVFARESDRSLAHFECWRSGRPLGEGIKIWVDPEDVANYRGALPTNAELREQRAAWPWIVIGWLAFSAWLFWRLRSYPGSSVGDFQSEPGEGEESDQ